MLELRNAEHRRIYVDTLQALARDAHYAGNTAARDFIRGYLIGLVPDVEREGFDAQLSVDSIPADIGQRCVDAVAKALEPGPHYAPIPEPGPSPAIGGTGEWRVPESKPEPLSKLLLQQSESLQW